VPFVVIQVIMIGLAIAFPSMIHALQGAGNGVKPATIDINIPTNDNNGGAHRRRISHAPAAILQLSSQAKTGNLAAPGSCIPCEL